MTRNSHARRIGKGRVQLKEFVLVRGREECIVLSRFTCEADTRDLRGAVSDNVPFQIFILVAQPAGGLLDGGEDDLQGHGAHLEMRNHPNAAGFNPSPDAFVKDMLTIGEAAFKLFPAVLAGFISYGMASRPGLVP